MNRFEGSPRPPARKLISRWKDLPPAERSRQTWALRSGAQPKNIVTPESKAEAEYRAQTNPRPVESPVVEERQN